MGHAFIAGNETYVRTTQEVWYRAHVETCGHPFKKGVNHGGPCVRCEEWPFVHARAADGTLTCLFHPTTYLPMTRDELIGLCGEEIQLLNDKAYAQMTKEFTCRLMK